MRVLSGIQPTGRFHWGNYFGAIRQYIDLQDSGEAYYFVANLHALTTVRDAATLRQLSLDAAIDLLALGLDPNRATLYLQSDVPEVSELCWLLMTGTPMGLLERCHAYKDKKAKGLPADAGLFTYPVLMAADILIYDANIVPVGEDQLQHIEVCRDIAGSFNHHFGETFVLPKAKLLDGSARVPGTDGEKMSKSYNNTLELFEPAGRAAEKNHADHDRLASDGAAQGARRRPSVSALYSLFANDARAGRHGGALSPRRLWLWRSEKGAGRPGRTVSLPSRGPAAPSSKLTRSAWPRFLADGASRARKKAAEVLIRAEKACGLTL